MRYRVEDLLYLNNLLDATGVTRMGNPIAAAPQPFVGPLHHAAPKPAPAGPMLTANYTNTYGEYNYSTRRKMDKIKYTRGNATAAAANAAEREKRRRKPRKAKVRRDEQSHNDQIVIPKYNKWIFPPSGPHQVYECTRKTDTNQGLKMLEIRDTARYLLWQLADSYLAFLSDPDNPSLACIPVFCYWTNNAVVWMCNRRADPAKNPVRIYGRAVGLMLWELSVFTDLDSEWLTQNWAADGGTRPCTNSDDATDSSVESFTAYTGWSEDQWQVGITKEPEGCNKWMGNPNWVTTGNDTVPGDFPESFFTSDDGDPDS
ncbi:hypothetical protein Dda_8352 [Drechslerella dactyloides]|uniref:Uncharacterized protein n=1 Tax=Drechslerella dactyloides TaxID=74499 RepID=A0AAD6IQ92_DREDA|nr:hypothetical protein Dda_8352 [Drechslerella dactyloides]